MFKQPQDFMDESNALYSLIHDKSDIELGSATQFKSWTIEEIISHLHVWNMAAHMSLTDAEKFNEFLGEVMQALPQGNLREFERKWLNGLKGSKLVKTWHDFAQTLGTSFADADPKSRLPWAGPSMSARSSITARLMETWAHGLAIYDLLGVERADEDRVENIVILGLNTFAWTFKCNGKEVPKDVPYLKLTAPSGKIWEYGTPDENNIVVGNATEFCQVITQTRNIADTALKTQGDTAQQWMSIAQCFAGPPEPPPAKGSRFVKSG
ncbi:MAG: TIGR03084 family protein [Robiginitomaculum sp.]|nr:TIGR03084 family protein [Robiginitomaculum sp.]